MPGLGAFALAGAVGGLGEGIIKQAEAAREERLAALKRQQDLADRQQDRAWQVEDRDLDYNRDQERIGRVADAYDDMWGDGRVGAGASQEVDLSEGTPARVMYDFFKSEGYSDDHIAGILGNYQQESGFNYAAVGDNGASVGMGQHQGERRELLNQKAEEWGLSMEDPLLYARFHHWETTAHPYEAGQFKRMVEERNPQSAEEWAAALAEYHWRPSEPHLENRQSYANGYTREIGLILADPDVDESVKDDIRSGLGIGSSSDDPPKTRMVPEDEDGDGDNDVEHEEQWDGNSWDRTGRTDRVRNDTVTDADGDDEEEVELSSGMQSRIERFARNPYEPDQVDFEMADILGGEVRRLIRVEGLSEDEALTKARGGMVFASEETTSEGGFLGIGGTEKTTTTERVGWERDGDGEFTGEFRYGDGDAGADGDDAPEGENNDPPIDVPEFGTGKGLGVGSDKTAPPADPQLPAEPATDSRQSEGAEGSKLPPGVTREQALREARDAIAAGAPRARVLERLQQWGLSEDDLNGTVR